MARCCWSTWAPKRSVSGGISARCCRRSAKEMRPYRFGCSCGCTGDTRGRRRHQHLIAAFPVTLSTQVCEGRPYSPGRLQRYPNVVTSSGPYRAVHSYPGQEESKYGVRAVRLPPVSVQVFTLDAEIDPPANGTKVTPMMPRVMLPAVRGYIGTQTFLTDEDPPLRNCHIFYVLISL